MSDLAKQRDILSDQMPRVIYNQPAPIRSDMLSLERDKLRKKFEVIRKVLQKDIDHEQLDINIDTVDLRILLTQRLQQDLNHQRQTLSEACSLHLYLLAGEDAEEQRQIDDEIEEKLEAEKVLAIEAEYERRMEEQDREIERKQAEFYDDMRRSDAEIIDRAIRKTNKDKAKLAEREDLLWSTFEKIISEEEERQGNDDKVGQLHIHFGDPQDKILVDTTTSQPSLPQQTTENQSDSPPRIDSDPEEDLDDCVDPAIAEKWKMIENVFSESKTEKNRQRTNRKRR
jgi:hypothetical protein